MERVLNIAQNEIGYLEKASDYQLDSKEANAGKNNFTKYWRDLSPSSQKNAWCQCFIDWCFEKAYGREMAKKLLCHGTNTWSYYTPYCSDYFKKKKQWHTSNPKRGDIIYFKNSKRICHVGIVTNVDSKSVYTIEGNTSSKSNTVVANGGGVHAKDYSLTNNRIAGYGRPDYSLVQNQKYVIGWNSDEKGWWYANSETTYVKNEWKVINHHWYYFNFEGYAVKGVQNITGDRYYFEESGELECALMKTDDTGKLVEWRLE